MSTPATESSPLGRERELMRLRAALERALRGHGSLVCLIGEDGIGRTALAQALAADAAKRDAAVVWGRCTAEAGPPAYWPWIQVLEALDPATARSLEPAVPLQIPPTGRSQPNSPSGGPPQPASARMTLFRRIAGLLEHRSQLRAMLIVLDDLHEADESSLRLLHHIAGRLPSLRVLLLATSREGTPVSAEGADTIELRGLDERATGQLVARHLGRQAGLALVRRIYKWTEGHPLFVEELSRLLAAREHIGTASATTELMLPASLRLALRRRLEPLAGDAAAVLCSAAVVGREFDVRLVAEIDGRSGPAVAAAAATAADEGLLAPAGDGRYRFRHELLRRTLLEDLTPEVRQDLHRRTAEAMQRDGRAPTRLAYHLRRAVPTVPAALAAERSAEAARQALDMLAYEDAAADAAEALQLGVGPDLRLDLSLLLGQAQQAAGEADEGRATLMSAASQARELQEPEMLARAALAIGAGSPPWAIPGPDQELINLLQEALTLTDRPPWPALLLAGLAEQQVAARRFDRADELSRRALQAVPPGADLAGCRALQARLLSTLPDPGAERSGLVQRLIEHALAAGDPEAQFDAWLWGINDGLERADRPAVDESWLRLRERAIASSQPHQLWATSVTAATLALLDGRLAEAEQHMDTARQEGRDVIGQVDVFHSMQLLWLRREQGRAQELEPLVKGALASGRRPLGWRAGWIGMLCELGRNDEARREVGRLPAHAWAIDVQDYEWPGRVTVLAEVCAWLSDRGHADQLYAALAPYAGQVVVSSFSTMCRGAVDRYLGLLAGTLGREDDAERHFDRAQTLHARLSSVLWLARTDADRALMRAAAGDVAGAHTAGRSALASAEGLGLKLIADRSRLAMEGPAGGESLFVREAPEELVFRREGEVWAIGRPGRPIRLRDRRGLGYLASLLAAPDQEQAALQLAGAVAASEQPVLDDAAKVAYRARLEELSAEIASTERLGESHRSDQARAEFDAVTAELKRAVGLHGRSRRLSGPAERARSSVTKAIRGAIEHVAEKDPVLGQHLQSAVRTGAFCRYVPDARHPISWRVTM